MTFMGRPGVAAAMLLIGVAIPVMFLTSRSDLEGTSMVWVGLVAVAAITLALGILLAISSLLAGVDPDAERIAARLADAPDQQRLLTRWLQRTRWARNVGGVAGLVWWALATRGNDGHFLVFALGGVAIGSMAAQLNQVRRRPGLQTASLERRTVSQYARASVRRHMAGVAVLAAVVSVAGFVYPDQAKSRIAGWGLAALAVLAVALGIQFRVSRRPRPALSTGLRYADDMARVLAIGKGLGEPATYFALAMVSQGFNQLAPSIGAIATVLSVITWFYALGMWWDNRRLGLDHLLKETAQQNGLSGAAGPGHRVGISEPVS